MAFTAFTPQGVVISLGVKRPCVFRSLRIEYDMSSIDQLAVYLNHAIV